MSFFSRLDTKIDELMRNASEGKTTHNIDGIIVVIKKHKGLVRSSVSYPH